MIRRVEHRRSARRRRAVVTAESAQKVRIPRRAHPQVEQRRRLNPSHRHFRAGGVERRGGRQTRRRVRSNRRPSGIEKAASCPHDVGAARDRLGVDLLHLPTFPEVVRAAEARRPDADDEAGKRCGGSFAMRCREPQHTLWFTARQRVRRMTRPFVPNPVRADKLTKRTRGVMTAPRPPGTHH